MCILLINLLLINYIYIFTRFNRIIYEKERLNYQRINYEKRKFKKDI